MTTLAKQFAVVFFLGFIILAMALGLGSMTGQVLSANANLVGLRYLGGGLMASGLALWIAKRRAEGGKPGLNPLIGMLVILGSAVLVLGAIFPTSTIDLLGPAGLGASASALVVGFLAMLISPAPGAKPLTARWPEGGEEAQDAHAPAPELHHDVPTIGEVSDEHAH